MSQKNKIKKKHRRENRLQREKQKMIKPVIKIKEVENETEKPKTGGLIEVKVPKLFDILNEVLITPLKVKKHNEVINPVIGKKYGEVYKVEQPEEGGIRVWITGYDEPYRGLPFSEFLEKTAIAKRTLKEEVFDMFNSFKKLGLFGKIKLVLSFKELKTISVGFISPLYKMIEECKFKSEKCSQPVRELIRVFGMFQSPDLLIEMMKEITLGVLEGDNAYRFRIQDYSEEVDREKITSGKNKSFVFGIMNLVNYVLKKELKQEWMSDFLGEIYRVMTLGITKERKPNMQPKMKMIRDLICLYLLVSKKTRVWLQKVVKEIKFNELKLSKEDICFCNCRKDYKFKYKRELGEVEGLVIQQKCRIFDEKMGKQIQEINELRKENNEIKLRELGVWDTMMQIETIQGGEKELVGKRTIEINKYEQILGELYKQRIGLLNQFLGKVENLIKGQELANK